MKIVDVMKELNSIKGLTSGQLCAIGQVQEILSEMDRIANYYQFTDEVTPLQKLKDENPDMIIG